MLETKDSAVSADTGAFLAINSKRGEVGENVALRHIRLFCFTLITARNDVVVDHMSEVTM